MKRKQHSHIDRNKTTAHRFAAINKLMGASVAKEPVTDEYAAALEIRAYTALDTITRGHGAKSQWDLLARCLNQAWIFAKGGLGAEVKDVLDASHEAMRRMIPEFDRTGRVAFACDIDRKKVEEALSLWGAQLRLATIGEVDMATQVVEREYWKYREVA